MAGNANSGKGRRPSTKGRPSTVPREIREAMYRLYDTSYTVEECVEWLRRQGYKMSKGAVQAFVTSERKRIELAALEAESGVQILEMFRQLSHDVAQYHADSVEIWSKIPKYDKNTMRGWKAVMESKQNAMSLQLKMMGVINAAQNATPEMGNAKEAIAEKLKIVVAEDEATEVDVDTSSSNSE